ncbi:MAG: hypothetical protein GY845_31520 [Planctomycetes bacterium]|nr:hypothetical protein [Planctomycetota bacterium]
MKNTKYHKNSAICLIILVLTSSSIASLAIRNYDNDPDLAAAMEYDSAEATDRSKVDRELAEKYYLEYLKKDIPSFQKARVYLLLGSLFTVGSDPRNGIMPDREKGHKYLEKVLQLEPERIDSATIRARTLLASSPLFSREEGLQKHLDVYEWLSSLNEEKFQKLWLPLEPDQKAILPITLKRLQNYVPNVKHSQAMNSVDLAIYLPDREARLAEIIGRFPDTEIADIARKKLNSKLEEVADEAAMSLLSANETLVETTNSVTVDTTDTAKLDKIDTATVDTTDTETVDKTDTPVTSTPSENSFSPVVSSGRPKVVIGIGFLGLCVVAGALVWTWRKKQPVNS